MGVRTSWVVRAGGAALLLGLGVPAASAVVGDAPTGAVAAATVKVDVGSGVGACSGALLDPSWIITAKSCFAGATGVVTKGAPKVATTVTVGRVDLTGTAGHVVAVDLLVPHPDQDVVLARLVSPVTDVTPVQVAGTAPVVGQELTVTGFGRTSTQVVPDTAHAATYTVTAVGGATIDIEAQEPGSTICKGDAGGPSLRVTSSGVELVAIHHRAYQGGCLGTATTLQGATETRVDNVATWITKSTRNCEPARISPTSSAFGDGQLIRTADGSIFIVAGGAKYGLSYAEWSAMGLPGFTNVSDAAAAALGSVPRDGTYLRDPATGSIYEIVSGTRYGLSGAQWSALGSPAYVNVPVGFIGRLADAAPGGPVLLRDPVTGSIYQVVGCARYPLTAPEWQALGFPAYVPAPGGLITRVPTGVPSEHAVLRDRTNGSIYQVLGGAKYGFSLAQWQALGSPAYTEVPPRFLAQITKTIPDGPVLMRNAATGQIYRVESGKKQLLTYEQWRTLAEPTYVNVPVAWLDLIPHQ